MKFGIVLSDVENEGSGPVKRVPSAVALVFSMLCADATVATDGPSSAPASVETPDPVGIYGHWGTYCLRQGPCDEKKFLQGMIVQNNNGCISVYWEANPSDHFAYAFFAGGRQVGNKLYLFRDGPSGQKIYHRKDRDVMRTAPCKIVFSLLGDTISYDEEESDECANREGRYLMEFNAPLLSRSIDIPHGTAVPSRLSDVMRETGEDYCSEQ